MISGCWPVRLQVWHPCLVFKSSLDLARRSCIETPAAPDQSQISDLVKGTRLLHILITDRLLWNEISVRLTCLKQAVTEKHHKFQLYKARSFQTTLFISKYQISVEIITPSAVYQRGITISTQVLGKAWHHIADSNDLYFFGNDMYHLYHNFSNLYYVKVYDQNYNVDRHERTCVLLEFFQI